MSERLNYYKAAPAATKAMLDLEAQIKSLSIPAPLRELLKMRVSQINGCAFCLDLHGGEARAAGVSQQKLDVLAAWRESSAFDARERAALAWADALTLLPQSRAADSDYAPLAAEFSPQEQVELTLIVTTINAWNRFAIGFRNTHPVRS